MRDALIAAAALVHGMTVVTRALGFSTRRKMSALPFQPSEDNAACTMIGSPRPIAMSVSPTASSVTSAPEISVMLGRDVLFDS
jgi:hypothetical protein